MKRIALSVLTAALLTVSAGASAWWNNWGGYGWNPYDPWDPRYWIEEFFGGGYYGGGPWGYGGGPWGYGRPWGGYGNPYYGGYGYPYHGAGHVPWRYGYRPYAQPQATPKAQTKSDK